ncbi:MAG: hypothetical protein IJF07_03835 [Lachnospiraceae bacterium]|nr:hypothetical protein [Lachnospiraceae bacterium]
MGLFGLFKKNQKEKKLVLAPINCTIKAFLEIVKQLDEQEVFLPVVVFRYGEEIHRMGCMFQGADIVAQKDGRTPAYIFDLDKFTSLEELIQYTVLRNAEDMIEILGYGSGEYGDAIEKIVCEDFYLDGKGEFWQLKERLGNCETQLGY